MEFVFVEQKTEFDEVINEEYDIVIVGIKHNDGMISEITIGERGIDMWYKDQEYAQIDFEKLQKLINEEEE